MGRGARVLLDNAAYHIITRGNQKQRVFNENEDFEEYLKRLKKYKREFQFKLYGFCLMPNHVHLIGEPRKKEDLSRFQHDLIISYTTYFNNKYEKVGHLWQGRFKSKVIIKDKYLLTCINYVELNPVRASMVETPCAYQWSSYRERNFTVEQGEQLLDDFVL